MRAKLRTLPAGWRRLDVQVSLTIADASAPGIPINELSMAWGEPMDGAEAMYFEPADVTLLPSV
jgi:hypothetical protein